MFVLVWMKEAKARYATLKAAAEKAAASRQKAGKRKSTKAEGLFKQVNKAIWLLSQDPRHPSLATHEFHSLEHPYDRSRKVFEAYIQQHTPGAYRLFWCYGPSKGNITLIAITSHP